MSITTLIYLADIVGNIKPLSIIILLVASIASLIGLIGNNEININTKKILSITKPIIIACLILIIITPTEKTMYSMVAIKAGNEIINTEIGNKSLLLINKKLDEMLADKK